MAETLLKIEARIRFLTGSEGGRSNPLLGKGSYRPNHNLYGRENGPMCLGFIELAEGERIEPGASINRELTLLIPLELKPEICPGREWRIQEGLRLVGIGTVLKLLDD